MLAYASDITGVRYSACCNLELGSSASRAPGRRSATPDYVLRRLAITPLLLLGIVTVAFIIARLIPADPLASIVGERQMNNEAVVDAAKRALGPRRQRHRAVRHVHPQPRCTATSARRSAPSSR